MDRFFARAMYRALRRTSKTLSDLYPVTAQARLR